MSTRLTDGRRRHRRLCMANIRRRNKMSVFVVTDAFAMGQRAVTVLDRASGSATCRGNLPGSSRRIVGDALATPAEPGHVPVKAPPEPARQPDDEPAPAR